MILSALYNYYHRASAQPDAPIIAPGYAQLGVAGELVLDEDGNLIAANPLTQQLAKKKSPQQMIVPLPPKRSGRKLAPAFLYETAAYLFGIYREPDEAAYRFEAGAALHRAVLEGCDDAGARAVLAFFDKRKPGSTAYDGVDTALLDDARRFVVFRLQGEGAFIHQRPAIQAAWQRYNARKTQDSAMGQCMITGQWGPIARVHGNIGGFGADKPTLIGFNQDAFCSFGKYGGQGANAPVGEEAAFAYVTALNMLVKDPAHCVNLAGDKVLFWAERDAPLEESLMAQFLGASDAAGLDPEQRDRIKGVLENLYHGGDPRDFQLDTDVRFYLLGVSSNKTRLVLRFFHESSFGTLLDNLLAHYRDIAVVGMRYPYPPPYYLLTETAVQAKRDNVPPGLEAALMRSILDATPYPPALFQAVLRRVRAEGSINALRAGILKATINRQAGKEELTMALDTTEKDQAYLMGRLFALLENIQQVALGDVNASVADKYLSAAMATPQSVFPTLLALSEKHMGKSIPQAKQGLRISLHRRVREVIDMMDLRITTDDKYAFPPTMDANSQGKFLVGYYHQIQSFYTKKDTQPQEQNDDTQNDE
ncbi:MAG: type I-C CRISPR-associated protein Cas8c/Csd1 [Eubacteriales bacterium]|nr:type I-C CRISPR-associated protein Cas8c/Csd1 [Eubacteriales bacterium]